MIERFLRRWLAAPAPRAWLALLGGVSLLLAACGGGVGTGGTGSFASGPITGFGSVIVNGIAFDDGDAAVEDGDGGRRGQGDLRLGMTVEIDGDAIAAGRARARRIRFDSALVGPVESVQPGSGSFTMLGQTVTVDETTVFDEGLRGRLALLVPGACAEVYALFDPAQQRFRATRVEARLCATTLMYRIRGLVSQLDQDARTFRIGGAVFDFSLALGDRTELGQGRFVRVALHKTPLADGRWRVAAFSVAQRTVDDVDAGIVKGLVSALTSRTSFQVDGRPVDATGAQFEGEPTLGARVEVEGEWRGGVLRARKVEVRSDDDERDRGFELRGAIESVNAAQKTFRLRGLTVGTSRSDLRYENGTAADLDVGRRVEVRAVLDGSGTALEATRIKFE
jgi:hypothetical protein